MASTTPLLDESFLHKLEMLSLGLRRPAHGQLKVAPVDGLWRTA